MVQKLYKAFKAANSNYQITFDVAWSADGVDGRYYDYAEISKWTDYLFVMSYDERSQMFDGPPCYARSNSAYTLNDYGIGSYRRLGIPANELILGLPWYGYDYPCISTDQSPYFMYESPAGDVHQVWFDNPQSLAVKYRYARDHHLRGVGFWNTDAIYSTDGVQPNEGVDMWNAVENFLN